MHHGSCGRHTPIKCRPTLLRDNVVMDSSVPCDFSVSYRDISEDESWQHFMYILSLNPDC